jgi:3-oxoacyl-[acyl-carrier-protein] synthase-1
MVREVYVASDNMITSLGFTPAEHREALQDGRTGIHLHHNSRLSPVPFWASLVNEEQLNDKFSAFAHPGKFTRFEKLIITSMRQVLQSSGINIQGPRVLVILSTTKGNIDLLNPSAREHFDENRIYLWHTAKLIREFFHLEHVPMIVSNACISGVLALSAGARYIRHGLYDHVIIAGADLVTEFVLSGFSSFLSLCEGPCKPFDKDRQGLSLGEGAGTIVLTADPAMVSEKERIVAGPGFSSNDANHISGPSRTGEGLYLAIKRTCDALLEQQNSQCQPISAPIIDYISAHGTATPYNDEMEAIAMNRTGLQDIPVNSFKGYWGHTLGAAGIIETVMGFQSMRHNMLFRTLGFHHLGLSQPLHIIQENQPARVQTFLKIASGFGGCNAAQYFAK